MSNVSNFTSDTPSFASSAHPILFHCSLSLESFCSVQLFSLVKPEASYSSSSQLHSCHHVGHIIGMLILLA
eukprot:765026-Hanusia_phi.AAC.2